jgi:hypothetical protein
LLSSLQLTVVFLKYCSFSRYDPLWTWFLPTLLLSAVVTLLYAHLGLLEYAARLLQTRDQAWARIYHNLTWNTWARVQAGALINLALAALVCSARVEFIAHDSDDDPSSRGAVRMAGLIQFAVFASMVSELFADLPMTRTDATTLNTDDSHNDNV